MRTTVLLAAVLALVLAACGGNQTDATATATPTPAATPTEEATPEPTESEPAETPEATDDGGTGSVIDGELSALLPDTVGGLAREELPPEFEQIMAGALAEAGAGAEDADVAWGLYGEGELMVIAMRIPDAAAMPPLEQWARMMAAMAPTGPSGEQLDAEQTNVGGKDVLRMTPEGADAEGTVYVYQAGDALFTVVGQSDDLAVELLSQLP